MAPTSTTQTNRGHSAQWPPIIEEPVEAQLVAGDEQAATVQILSIALDSVHLSLPSELSLVSGQDVQILLNSSTRRFATVQLVEYLGTGCHCGVRWKCAHHRDAVRAAVLLSDYKGLSDSATRFNRKLPDLLYRLWQFMDAGRLSELADVITPFKSAAKLSGHDLVEKCDEIEDAIKNGVTEEIVARILDELCRKCALRIVRCDPNMPPSAPVKANAAQSDSLEHPNEFLGTPGWVVGTAAVLAGYLLVNL